MISFVVSLVALLLGYFIYGRFVERLFGPDDRVTPAQSKADGVDFMALPTWRIYMIQFLNIAGTGPIFGAIMGAKFGPASYVWIVLGCIFAGAVHDYLGGMLSLRHGGIGLPEIIGKYLGKASKDLLLFFSLVLMVLVGAVFVYSPALILDDFCGTTMMWIIIIFAYYAIATLLPVKGIIGHVYPLFALSMLFMAVALLAVLLFKWPSLPEVWDGLGNKAMTVSADWKDQLFPCMFVTISCGAVSGFHATQSPLMARCLKNEHLGRPVFYGAMITEGVIALIWATIGAYFFYAEPHPGYEEVSIANNGFLTAAPKVVNIICNEWLGVGGAVLALLGIVAAPITTGDTALRSARLMVADFLKIPQKSIRTRLLISIPLFLVSLSMLYWQIENPDGFAVIWQYVGLMTQTLAVFTLWAVTVYLFREGKAYIVTLIPALFMTTVCFTYLFVSKQTLSLPESVGYPLGLLSFVVSLVWFLLWRRRTMKKDNLKS